MYIQFQDMFSYSEEKANLNASNSSSSSSGSSPRREEGYYNYTLSGIISHIGAINSGHYYSYVKDNSSNISDDVISSVQQQPYDAYSYDKVFDTWTEFNDSRVSRFDPKDIPRNCFGGPKDPESPDQNRTQTISYQQSSSNTTTSASITSNTNTNAIPMKQFSAYMLVYKRTPTPRNSSPPKSPSSLSPQNKIYKIIFNHNIALLRDSLIISK